MPVENRSLAEYYDTARGQAARRLISRRLRMLWPDLSGRRLLGLGYPAPYLRPYLGEAERVIAAVAADGPLSSRPAGSAPAAAVEENALPFPDAFFDCVLIVHGLETVESLRPFMREVWRVLTSEGRLVVVAPNRAGLWAHFESTPFGHGRPYSRAQLQSLLRDSLFAVERWDSALFMPPFGSRRPRSGRGWERVGRRLWPRLAGVHIVEATKSLYAPAPVESAKARRLRPAAAGVR